jgi:DNA repair exonuclease SbcCD ATPase subunit
MYLKRIELTNYRQHRQLDVDFSGNLIAVLGPNGCGKSNLIGAIQFAFTGEQPGFTKADLTTSGETNGSVRLFFTAGPRNDEFVVTRKSNGDVVLKVGDETIKQARKAVFNTRGKGM